MLLYRFRRLQKRLKDFAEKNNIHVDRDDNKFLILSDVNMYIIFTKYTRLKYVQLYFVEKGTYKIIRKYRTELMYERVVFNKVRDIYKRLNLIKLLENV